MLQISIAYFHFDLVVAGLIVCGTQWDYFGITYPLRSLVAQMLVKVRHPCKRHIRNRAVSQCLLEVPQAAKELWIFAVHHAVRQAGACPVNTVILYRCFVLQTCCCRSPFVNKADIAYCWDLCRIQMLDAVRYLIVWNPVILIALHFLLHELGLDKGLQANRASLNSFNATAANASLGLNSSSLLSNSTGTVRLF